MENYKKPLPADFLEEHLREKHKGGRVTATSFDDIKKALKRMKNTETGKKILRKQLVSVNTNDVQMVINELEKKGYVDSTVKKTQNLLSGAFAIAVRMHLMSENCALSVTRSGIKKDYKKFNDEILDAEAIRAFVEEALSVDENGEPLYQYGAGVALQLVTGCRSGEIRALHWTEVHEEAIQIEYSVTWVEDLGWDGIKGSKIIPFLSRTKSNNSRREITYEKDSIIDKCLIRLRQRYEKITDSKGLGLVMPTRTGYYVTPNNYNKVIHRILDKLEEKHLSSHKLRHSFISYLVNDGKRDLSTVASIVGHGDTRVTLKYANHTQDEKAKEAIRMVSRLTMGFDKRDEISNE